MAENRELALVLKLVADQFQQELKNSQGALGSFNSFVKDWKTQLTAAGTALMAVAKSAANFGEEALKGAQKTGQTVETFTALSFAAKMADIEQQQLIVGLKALSVNMAEAARQTGDGELLFRRLGVSATDATGQLRPTEQVLMDLADVFARSADGAGKMETSVKLFGKAGVEMIPFLNMGRAGIAELMAEAKRLGVVLSTEAAQEASAFNDEIKRLESSMRGFTQQLGGALIPTMTSGLDLVTSMIVKMRELGSETGTVGKNLKNMSDAFGQTGIGQSLMDTFTALGFGHRKGEGTLPREQFWFDLLGMPAPGSGVLAPGGGSAGGGGGDKPQMALSGGPDLKKLQEDYRLYITGLTAMGQEKLDKEKAAYQLYITGITAMGQEKLDKDRENLQLYLQGLNLMGEEAKRARDREQQGLMDNQQAWIEYGQQVGASQEFLYERRLDLVRATLAKEFDLNVETAGRLLIAWQNNDTQLEQDILARTTRTEQEKETIMLRTLTRVAQANQQASGDFFAGWVDGLRRYATDQTMFGLAADMSRRFLQTTEQGVQRFLFDAAEGRLQRMRDVAKSILTIINQLVAQMGAQLMVKGLIGAFSGMGFGFGGGESSLTQSFAASGTGFATGGTFTVPGTGGTDRTAVGFWATPGETVSVRTPGQGGGGSPVNIAITVNAGGGMQQSGAGDGANFSKLARDLSRLVEAKLIEEQRPGGLLAGGMA